MKLTEQHIIKKSDPLYNELDNICFLSKNLYNQVLYRIRQTYFENKEYISIFKIINAFTKEQQADFTALPRKVSQSVCKQVDFNFRSFFNSLKSNKIKHKISIPKYLKKNGRNIAVFTSQALSQKELKKGFLKLSGCQNKIKIIHKNIRQVRVIPLNNRFIIEIIYEIKEKEFKQNNNYAGIDLGLNNLAAVAGNNIKPFIINGRPLKSINQYYNKKLSEFLSRQTKCNNKNVNKNKIIALINRRNNKVKNYMHKASRILVNQLVSNNISQVVIGHNKKWKQDINIGKRNNQNFTQVPFNAFINIGIKSIKTM